MRIALAQIASPLDEPPEDRRERVTGMLLDAPDADLVLLPELWAPGYFAFDDYADRGESVTDGPTVTAMARVARERQQWIHLGSVLESLGDGRLRNTAALIGPDGVTRLTYSKMHVFGYRSKEAELLEPGTSIEATDTPFGRLATTTCYDLRFPGLWQNISDLGTEIALVPAAWPHARVAHWRLLTSARAVEHQLLVVACNAAGSQGETFVGGHSRVVDPWGETLLELGSEEEIAVCDVPDDVVAATRAEFPVLGDRLPTYANLSTTS